jgi:hypothetical protein
MHLPVLLSAVFELLSPTQVGKVKVDKVVWTDVRELDLEGQGDHALGKALTILLGLDGTSCGKVQWPVTRGIQS